MRNSLYFLLPALLLSLQLEAQKILLKERLNADPAPLKIFTMGGSLSSGVQNDGINKQFQSESFAALLFKQLNSGKFALPDFEPSETVNVKVDDYGTPVFETEKKRILEGVDGIEFSKDIRSVHNFSVPFQQIRTIGMKEGKYIAPNIDSRQFHYLSVLQSHNPDFSNSSYKDIFDLKVKEDFDFFIYELGFDDFLSYLKAGGYRISVGFLYSREPGMEQYLINNLASTAQGVIINIPDPKDLPFFNILNNGHLEGLTSLDDFYIKVSDGTQTRRFDEKDLILYNRELYPSLVNTSSSVGRNYETALTDQQVLTSSELSKVQITVYNSKLSYLAKKKNLAVVDLYSLYKKIFRGEYVTHDGVKIDPSFPGGNFFSADGIFPSSLGHRVICNEIITTINAHYGLKIKYLPTI